MPAAAETSAAALLVSLESAWRGSDALFEMIAPDALHDQPIALRHPFIFYLGHLPAFAWNQVMRGVLGEPAAHPEFDTLFERGIDPVGDEGYRPPTAWPERREVIAYRDRVRAALRESPPRVDARAESDVLAARGRIYALVIEHERMHQETLLYMLQQLPFDRKRRPADWPAAPAGLDGLRSAPLAIPAGVATLGAPFETLPFGWDNEFPEQRVEVPAFTIDSCPVRNDELAEFLEAGGYETRRFWDDAGWAWKERSGVRAPAFWTGEPGRWRYLGLFEEWPLERVGAWPVYVSWAEARAFAAWRERRLPTEAEFHRAAFGTPSGRERAFPWGEEPPSHGLGNFGLRLGSPAPVGSHPRGASAWGVHELVGNGWEWTATPFAGLPGFRAYARTYPGYSKDFFDGLHYVMKGASWATDDRLLRRSFRNWFQPHYPYVFAKFRTVAR